MSSNVLFQRGEEDGDSDAWDDTALIKAYDNAVSAMKTKLAAQHPEFSIPNGSPSKKKKKKGKPKKKKSSNSKTSYGWKAGDFCQAVFTEDGELYSAQILSVNDDGTCFVKYMGYGNEELQTLDSLLPPESDLSSQEIKTETASEADSVYEAQEEKHSNRRKYHKGAYIGGKPSKSTAPPWNWNSFAVPPAPPPVAPHNHYPPFAHPSSFPAHSFQPPQQSSPMFPGIPPPPPVFNNPGVENENEALYSMLISWYMSGYHTGYYQGLKNAKSTSLHGGPH